ncbi:MAG TPA: response regulator [Bacteroidia bacterium]|nr:response regulator [Bacteroidia bacterium]
MKKPIKKKKPAYKYHTVMLIDDNELDNFINQKIIESNLFAENIYVNTSGVSALEFLKNILVTKDLADNLIPNVIFIDINMPLMDGFQFVEEYLKLSDNIKTKSKLVILTSSISTDDKNMAAKYGSEILFINKPLNEKSLDSI